MLNSNEKLTLEHEQTIILIGKEHPDLSMFQELLTGRFRHVTLKHQPLIEAYHVEILPTMDHREISAIIKKLIVSMDVDLKECHLFIDPEINDKQTIHLLKEFLIFTESFDKYHKKKSKKNKFIVHSLNNSLLIQASQLAKSINFARELVNEPANIMTPSQLAHRSQEELTQLGVDVKIIDEIDIQKLGMEAFYSVAKGSKEEAKLIVMTYKNNESSNDKIALVGKGVTYDSGGYAIKPAKSMASMHTDMAGAAAVIGAMHLLAQQKAKVNVVAVVAACENMISSHSFKNGDIISSMSGKYIEVINTDAEGRLTLADAIWYAHQIEKANRIVDIATLTGAVIAALGHNISGVISNDEELYHELERSTKISGDKIWRLPCDEELAKCNKSQRADLKNASTCGAGTTTAALFLREFTNNIPWTHIDIAGTAYKFNSEIEPDGASGVGVEFLARTCEALFK